jgi:hypothetical protein
VVPTQQPQQASDDPFGGFASWLGSLFDNPDNLNEAQQQPPVAQQSGSEMPVQDVSGGDNFDFGGGGDLFSAIGSFFGGFENGGPVGSFARGGLVRKANGGRPDRTANAQPGVAVPTGYRNTDPGGGYSARRSVTPGYARGGPVEDGTSLDGAVDLGGGSAPAPQVEAPAETSSAPLVSRGAIPTEGFGDEAPIIGPNSVEAKQQAALEKYAEQRAISQQMRQPKNLRELLMSAATDVVHNVQSDYGIDRAVQRQQGQAVPTGEDKDPISAFFDMLTGAPQEAAPPEKVKALGDVVDPSNRLTEGMRTTAGMAAGVEYLLNKGDYKGAQEMARSVMFHQQLQAAKYGDQAVELLRQGKNEQAVQTMVKGQDQIPDGTTVKAKSTPDGGAIVTQKDENGKVMGHHRLTEAQLMGMALGLKDGTAYWQSIVHLANGDKGEMPHSEAYQQYQQRALPPAPTPMDQNSPQYKLHQEALSVVGAMPELPQNFQQMTPAEQKEVLAGVREQRQAWTPQYSQYMQGGRQERGFDYRTENREDNQKFRTDERVAGQEYHTGERIAGQKYRTDERVAKEDAAANKPLTPRDKTALETGVSDAADNFFTTQKVTSEKSKQAIRSIAFGLSGPGRNNIPYEDAVTSAAIIASPRADIKVSSDGKTMTLPNGRTVNVTPDIVQLRNQIAGAAQPATGH